MFQINTYSNALQRFGGFEMDQSLISSSEIANLSASQHQETDITIMTSEGDRVTISGETRFKTDYFDYSSLRRTNGSYLNVEATGISFESSSDLSFVVEGNLNEEELADIRTALQNIDKIMKGVLSGDMYDSLQNLSSIGGLASINSLEASMSYEKIVSYSQQSTLDSLVTPPDKGSKQEVATNISDPVNNITDQMMKHLEVIDPKKAAKPVDRYFKHLFDELSNKENKSDERLKMAKILKKRMFQKIMDKSAKDFSKVGGEQDAHLAEEKLNGKVDDIRKG